MSTNADAIGASPEARRCAVRWAFNIRAWNPSAEEWDFALSLIPPADAERVKRFHFEKDRKLALGSRLLQRKLVHSLSAYALRLLVLTSIYHCCIRIRIAAGIPWDSVQIGRTKEGKPFLANSPLPSPLASLPCWNFNVTHHGGIVALAAEPAALVGVDVMDTTERPNGRGGVRPAEEFFSSFTDNFAPSEWRTIRGNAGNPEDKQFEQFYRHWAMKEAYIKAVVRLYCIGASFGHI